MAFLIWFQNFHSNASKAIFLSAIFCVSAITSYGQTAKQLHAKKRAPLVETAPLTELEDTATNGFQYPQPIAYFADTVHIQLYFDKIEERNTTLLHNSVSFSITNESDYIQVHDSIYIKVFIARGQEYGRKIYLWRWDYYKKSGTEYRLIGNSIYWKFDFNTDFYLSQQDISQGSGHKGDPNYLMIYYRFKAY
jgi:hypothetical protein